MVQTQIGFPAPRPASTAQPQKAQHSHLCPSGLGTATALCLLHAKLCRVSSLIALPQTRPGTLVQFPLIKTARCWKTPQFLFHSHSFFFIMRKPEDIGIPTHSSTQTAWKHSKKEFKQGRKTRTRSTRDTKQGNCAHKPQERSSPSFQPLPAQLSQKSLSPNTVPARQVQCQSV